MRVFGELTTLGERMVELGRIWGVGRGGAIITVEEEQDRRQEVEEDTVGAITIITAVEEDQHKDGEITIMLQIVLGADSLKRQTDSLRRSGETLEQVVGQDSIEYQKEGLVCEYSHFSIT